MHYIGLSSHAQHFVKLAPGIGIIIVGIALQTSPLQSCLTVIVGVKRRFIAPELNCGHKEVQVHLNPFAKECTDFCKTPC